MVVTEEFKKLFPFRSHFFEDSLFENERIHYIDEGAGDPILCLHGNPTWSFYYRNLVESFKSTHRVIVPDHLGCGWSSKAQNFSYQVADHIHNLERLVLKLDLHNITLVVHDWGGAIGFGFALRQKHRIKNIVILNTAAFLAKDMPKRIALLRASADFLIRRANLFCLAASFMTTVKKLPREVRRAYLAPYRNYHDRVAIAGFVKDIPMKRNHPSYSTLEGIEKSLRSLSVPTLILWGARDFCFHLGFYEKWKEIYPHAQTKVFENAGHYVLEDETNEVLQEIRNFL